MSETLKEKLNQELQIINTETCVYQLEYINPNHYNKEEFEQLHEAITNKIESNNDKEFNKERKRFQNKIWQQLIQINTNESFESKLYFENNNSYLVFKILFEYYEKRTRLATTKLTWENI